MSAAHEKFQITTILIFFHHLTSLFQSIVPFPRRRTIKWNNCFEESTMNCINKEDNSFKTVFLHRIYMEFSGLFQEKAKQYILMFMNFETTDYWMLENWNKNFAIFSSCAIPSVHFARFSYGEILNKVGCEIAV